MYPYSTKYIVDTLECSIIENNIHTRYAYALKYFQITGIAISNITIGL